MSGHPVWNVRIQNVLNQAPPLLADFVAPFQMDAGMLEPLLLFLPPPCGSCYCPMPEC